jgi:YHS domain-containing protein
MVQDPVCGKTMDPLRARAVGIFDGVTYYFCSAECKQRFAKPSAAPPMAEPPMPATVIAAEAASAPRTTPKRILALALAVLIGGVMLWVLR